MCPETKRSAVENAPAEVSGVYEPISNRRIMDRRSPGGVPWENNHPVNVRLSIPLPFSRYYLTIVAGKERRRTERRSEDRQDHPIGRKGNVIFLLALGSVLGLAALALIQFGAVFLLEWAEFLVGR